MNKDDLTKKLWETVYFKKDIPRKMATLLKKGADPFAYDPEDGYTILHKILCYTDELQKEAAFNFIIDHGTRYRALTRKHETALHFTAFYGSDRMSGKILGCGVNVNAMTKDGKTPLIYAVEGGVFNKALVDLLVNEQIDINRVSVIGTAVDAAILTGNWMMKHYLQKLGGKSVKPSKARARNQADGFADIGYKGGLIAMPARRPEEYEPDGILYENITLESLSPFKNRPVLYKRKGEQEQRIGYVLDIQQNQGLLIYGPDNTGDYTETFLELDIIDYIGQAVLLGKPDEFQEVIDAIFQASITKSKQLSIHNSELKEIPWELFELKNLEELTLQCDNLKTISNDLTKLEKLIGLQLESRSLKVLPPFFADLTGLKKLAILCPNLENYGAFFRNPINLEDLALDCGDLTIPPQEIAELAALKRLHLKGKKLTKLTNLTNLLQEIGKIRKLETLKFINRVSEDEIPGNSEGETSSDDMAQTIPEELGNLFNLEELDFSNVPLKSIPACIGKLKRLKKLTLQNTGLEEVPPEIGSLESLEFINFNTGLTKLTPEITKLTQLAYLKLRTDHLSNIPPLKGFTNLKEIHLINDYSQWIPEDLKDAQSLTKLVIEYSTIEELPEWFFELKNLKELTIRCSRLKTINQRIEQMTGLEILNIHCGRLQQFPFGLTKLSALRILNLRGSGIAMVPQKIGNLIKLEYLDLNGTKITELPDRIGDLVNLKSLDLGFTGLTSLPIRIRKLQRLESLSLEGSTIKELPEGIIELVLLWEKKGLNIDNCSLEIPPRSFIDDGRNEVIQYFVSKGIEEILVDPMKYITSEVK